jgi:hypothetical protein
VKRENKPDIDVVDEEDALAFEAHAQGIPLDFGGEKRALITLPTAEEAKLFANTRVRTCGMCQHFRRKTFQAGKEKFLAQLIHDYEWRAEHLGDDPSRMGVCGAKDHVVTGPNSLACDNFKEKR